MNRRFLLVPRHLYTAEENRIKLKQYVYIFLGQKSSTMYREVPSEHPEFEILNLQENVIAKDSENYLNVRKMIGSMEQIICSIRYIQISKISIRCTRML